MQPNTRRCIALLSIVTWSTSMYTHADIIQFNTSMEDDWWDSVNDVTTIDFTGFQDGTSVSDQWSHLGVTFEGTNFIFESFSMVNDGFGLHGFGGTWVYFDKAMNWIAADFAGTLSFALYSDNQLIFDMEFDTFGGSGTGKFGGIISDTPFNVAYLFRPILDDPSDNQVFVDDLHFGAIPSPGALGLLGIGALYSRGRRRS